MPNHKTHDTIGYIAAPIVTSLFYILEYDAVKSILFFVSFVLSNYFLSPDLDLDSTIYKRWGFLRFVWYPYKKYVKHRSWVSHSGPISATIRFIYLAFWIFVVSLFLFRLQTIEIHLLTYAWFYCIVYIAMVVSDCIHTLADWSPL